MAADDRGVEDDEFGVRWMVVLREVDIRKLERKVRQLCNSVSDGRSHTTI